MTTSGYRPPRWLRNPHLQSVLSSLPLRRASGARRLDRLGATTTEHVIEVDGGVRLQGFHSTVPGAEPRALQLRYLQTLADISSEKTTTIVFPIPIDIVKPFLDNR